MESTENQEKPSDFLTPKEAEERLKELGYKDRKFRPPSHELAALWEIANSDQGASVAEVKKSLQDADPVHGRQLENFSKKFTKRSNQNSEIFKK